MPTPVVTIKVQAGARLMERIQAVAEYLDVRPANFVEFAIENELSRQESQHALEQAALVQLREEVLASGQAVTIHNDDEPGDHDTCQLCLRTMPRSTGVEGPLLCDDCHRLAKGGHGPAVG
jgi:hypothetical protein